MAVGTTSVSKRQTRLAPEARRRQIVEEATRLISQSGFNAVSLADIGDACGIKGPSVLHYFPTMNDLLAAVLEQRDHEVYYRGAFPSDVGHREEVVAYLRRVVETNAGQREIVRLFVMLNAEALDPEHPAHRYFADRNRLTLVTFEQMLAWKQDPSAAAHELLAFWQGLETLWVANPAVDLLRVWDSFAARFFC